MNQDSHHSPLTADELECLRSDGTVREIELHARLASTNARAMQLAANRDVTTPLLIVAEIQTAGRGRGTNAWWSAPGALTFSLLLDAADWRSTEYRLPRVSLSAGVAVCEVLETLMPGADLSVKWPNDVLLRRQKVVGILVEMLATATPRAIVGIGVNVNNSIRSGPPELHATATSLVDELGYPLDRARVLIDVVRGVRRGLDELRDDSPGWEDTWQRRCALTGRVVHLAMGSHRWVGVCRGVDADGALLLETATDTHRCYAGVVERVE